FVTEEPARADAEADAFPLMAIAPRAAIEVGVVDRILEIDGEVRVDPHADAEAAPHRGIGVAGAVGNVGTDARRDVPALRLGDRGTAYERQGDERTKGITFHSRGLLSRFDKARAR